MTGIKRIFCVIIFSFFFFARLYAQYVNVDSLVQLPGESELITLHTFEALRADLAATELLTGNEILMGHFVPSGKLLSNFEVPSDGKVISRYGIRSGRMHTGIDIKMGKGDTIYSTFQGIVTRARYYYGYGNMVVIDHGNSIETSYAHLSAFLVDAGEIVEKNQPIGLAGSTGRATTSHLHFEIREADRHFNPELVFDFENGTVRDEVYEIQYLAELLPAKKAPVQIADGTIPNHYTVASGDSLWKISRRYKTSVQSLCMLNNLDENTVLNVGMTLKLF